jgi:hypothetical protein
MSTTILPWLLKVERPIGLYSFSNQGDQQEPTKTCLQYVKESGGEGNAELSKKTSPAG